MDEKNYLTDSIFLQDNKTYYEEDGGNKLIKNHNWHHILSEYGWEKLPKQWIKKLNTYLDKPKKKLIIWDIRLWSRWGLFIPLYKLRNQFK